MRLTLAALLILSSSCAQPNAQAEAETPRAQLIGVTPNGHEIFVIQTNQNCIFISTFGMTSQPKTAFGC